MMRVLVVAEIRLYRDGVAAALAALPDVEHVSTAANGALAVVSARRSESDVVLLDMAIDSAAETAAALITARPTARVVALGVREDEAHVVACAEAGVLGYVSRDASLEEVACALRSAMLGEVACSGKVAAGLVHHIATRARSGGRQVPTDQLTRREREVLHLLKTHMSNKEIARALDLQLSTVKNHVHNVLTKLGAAGRHDVEAPPASADLDPDRPSHGSLSGSIAAATS